jgi:hypothetical protein
VCLLRFGVNGSFYLLVKNLAYVAWYKTLQVCRKVPCKFHASSMQVPCMCHLKALHKNVQRFCVACAYGGIQEFYCVHPSCMRTCNAKALHVFVQLGCKNLQVSLSETCTHLVQATYVARDCGIGHASAHHTTTTPQKPQHTSICLQSMDNDPPSSPGGKSIKSCYKS